ncbi:MAG: hypothetical protein Q7S61_04125 [bacterium]|nr:hypothetical protein [bacterium]
MKTSDDLAKVTPIEDAEIVTDESALSTDAATNSVGLSVLEIENIINGYIADLEKLKGDMKVQRDMFNDAFNNDAEYAEQQKKVKEATRIKSGIKQRILKQPAVALVADKLKSMKEEMADVEDAMSSYLEKYRAIANTNQIMGTDGEMREIVYVAKLVKKKV